MGPVSTANLHPSVAERLARLAPDQRAAATVPPGPVLCVAPAGSGKTTVLVARIAWSIDGGASPAEITAMTFNRRAAEELRERVDPAVAPLGVSPGAVRVGTFHALGRRILLDAGVDAARTVADRESIVRSLWPKASAADVRGLDDAFSRLKLDAFVTAGEVARDPEPGPVGEAFVTYQRALAAGGQLDFDDLVAEAVRRLERDGALLGAWRRRATHLLVDEAQDLDRTQLRLAFLLAAPLNRIFLVGDDDQSIYGWRLADVRRILGLAESLPGLTRLDLEVNYRCPDVVVRRADRLIRTNVARFAKKIRARADAPGAIILAADAGDDEARAARVLQDWPDDDATRAFLARTNRGLHPAAIAALEAGRAFAAPDLELLVESPILDGLMATIAARMDPHRPFLPTLAAALDRDTATATDPNASAAEPAAAAVLAAAVLGWAARYANLSALIAAIAETRERLARLRRDDAPLVLATAHSTKGLEFDHVAVVDMDEGRFPSGRALAEAADPVRAMEEERRLAYVAWTRARRTLTLVFDPGAPSPFLREAFDPEELAPIPARDGKPR